MQEVLYQTISMSLWLSVGWMNAESSSRSLSLHSAIADGGTLQSLDPTESILSDATIVVSSKNKMEMVVRSAVILTVDVQLLASATSGVSTVWS